MKTLLAAVLLLPGLAFGQASTPATTQASAPVKVSLDARGEDIREVLATLFAQAKKPYALDAAIKGKLYVKLDAMPYEKALAVVLAQSGLVAKNREGVVMISPAKAPTAPAVKPTAPVKTPVAPKVAEAKPLAEKVALGRRVTTRLTRAPLADVFASFDKQTKVKIEMDTSVPAYRVDAFFVGSSLRYAMDQICKAAGLRYEFADNKIVVYGPGA
jgi:type II secretory pathway component GspD/PulD (secretin)